MRAALRQSVEVGNVRVTVSFSQGKGGFLRRADGSTFFSAEPGSAYGFRFDGSHDFAVVSSVRGLDPITGLRASPDPFSLGRGAPCPVDHAHGRLGPKGSCKTCGHSWPRSNYLVAARSAVLPGRRTGEGEYRPFVAVEDGAKDVVSAVAPEDVASSVGFLFYRSVRKQADQHEAWWHWPSGTRTTTDLWYSTTAIASPCASYSSAISCLASSPADVTPVRGSLTGAYVGASSSVVAQADPGVGRADFLHPEDLEELPCGELQAEIISWESMQGLLAEEARVTEGPFAGIPLS